MPLNHSSKYAQLTKGQFEIIGRIVIEFSNIDFYLKIMLTKMLLTEDFLGRTYTERLQNNSIVELIKNAMDLHQYRFNYKIISEETINEIRNILPSISDVREKRNKFAHYCWSKVDDDTIFGTKLSSKQRKINIRDNSCIKISTEELNILYTKSYDLVESIERIIKKLPVIDYRELFNKYKTC